MVKEDGDTASSDLGDLLVAVKPSQTFIILYQLS